MSRAGHFYLSNFSMLTCRFIQRRLEKRHLMGPDHYQSFFHLCMVQPAPAHAPTRTSSVTGSRHQVKERNRQQLAQELAAGVRCSEYRPRRDSVLLGCRHGVGRMPPICPRESRRVNFIFPEDSPTTCSGGWQPAPGKGCDGRGLLFEISAS